MKMNGNKSAILGVGHFISAIKKIQKEISILSASVTDTATQSLFYNTAIELIPYGRFNAQLVHPRKKEPFILIDTSIVDFFGNMSALYVTLYANNNNQNVLDITEQEVIDILFASAEIFYDGLGWESELNAIYAKKLNYNRIHEGNRQRAMTYSLASRLFIISHEIGHLYHNQQVGQFADKSSRLGKFWNDFWNALGGHMLSHQKERMADIHAVEIMLQFASTYKNNPPLFFDILNGVHFCMDAIHTMQMLKGKHKDVEGLKLIGVNERPTHPIGGFRISEYRDRLKKMFKDEFDSLFHPSLQYHKIVHPYIEKIVSGAVPSTDYFQMKELARNLLEPPWVWDNNSVKNIYGI
ncbi:hypothetical protein QUF58_08325 [Anaerolineales bacterium HSG24]|nr:hypothetical protein [Anaerolineales bacterium HSG24]